MNANRKNIKADIELKEIWEESLHKSNAEDAASEIFDSLQALSEQKAPHHLRERLLRPERLIAARKARSISTSQRWALPVVTLLVLFAISPLFVKHRSVTPDSAVSDEQIIDAIFNVSGEDSFSIEIFSQEIAYLESTL